MILPAGGHEARKRKGDRMKDLNAAELLASEADESVSERELY